MEPLYKATEGDIAEAFALWRTQAALDSWDDTGEDPNEDAKIFIKFLTTAQYKKRILAGE